ncbi:MAG: flagellar biosynthetic protein FliQ [Bdellovibrionales bacterium]|nr:flagellar biosynthetic protein FliQ [Bdellovibrionales bacterium]
MDEVLPYAAQALWVGAKISALPLAASMLVGLIVSIFQAATQIQEQTLSFVPKLLSAVLVFIAAGAWISDWAVSYTAGVLHAAAFIAN